MLFRNTLQLVVGFLFVTSINATWEKERAAELGQNMNRLWIIKDLLGNPVCPGSHMNEIVYEKDLTKKLSNMKILSNVGQDSEGVYTFPPGVDYEINGEKVPGDSLVVKLVDPHFDPNSCEVEILRRIGSLRDHGKMWREPDFGSEPKHSPSGSPSDKKVEHGSNSGSDSGSDSVELLDSGVIVMNKVKGRPLIRYEWWEELSKPQKKELVEKTLVDIKNKVYGLLKSERLLYADLELDNLLVETETDDHGIHSFKEAHLVDFGFPGIFAVRKIPETEEFDSWFYGQFNYYSADLRKAQNWGEFSGTQLAESSASGAGKRPSNHDAGTGGTGQAKKQRQRRRKLRMIEDY